MHGGCVQGLANMLASAHDASTLLLLTSHHVTPQLGLNLNSSKNRKDVFMSN